ncbi:MAG: thermonuclease family protein [Microcoleus sp. PH2017_15_JOR_U_A]|uniref:thermonuclease family protein n=1 Tax=Microcoleus sp. PH2017_15_JOR_U_A TaxID=2798826 RepID=UPI001D5E30CA|nr:thermonuclease family protein [Microcoleus sp. PH2017_15_JOR_U_A]MCC3497431.1 thermonuclease family protein [Microcoleus sp. PH2017_15_JOR_U_A]
MTQNKISLSPTITSLSAVALLFLLSGCPQKLPPNNYAVKRISDGDTLVASDAAGKDIKVRFACVDAPEIAHTNAEKNSKKAAYKNQFKWGNLAEQRMQQLVKEGGGRVVLTVTDTDRYGRKVSEVRLPNGTFAQEVLLREGLAMVYTPYLKNCPSATVVQQAEAEAKKNRRGIWGDSKFVPAWDFRHSDK